MFSGPAVGAALYDAGGFMLPFLVVGAISTVLSLTLLVTIPNMGSGATNSNVNGEATQLQERPELG